MKTLLLILALFCACEPADTSDVVVGIEANLSVIERSSIAFAADRWNEITTPDHHVLIQDGANVVIRLQHDMQDNAEGSYYAGVITVRDDLSDDRFLTVVTHEMGHALGLHHVSKGLMDPSASSAVFTSDDYAECRRVRACE